MITVVVVVVVVVVIVVVVVVMEKVVEVEVPLLWKHNRSKISEKSVKVL